MEEPRQPDRRIDVSTKNQSEPQQGARAHGPQEQDRPQRRPPLRQRRQLRFPAPPFRLNRILQHQPRGFEPPRRGLHSVLPQVMGCVVECFRRPDLRAGAGQLVERLDQLRAAGGKPRRQRPALRAGELAQPPAPAGHPHAPADALDLVIQGIRHPVGGAADGMLPGREPGAAPDAVEHPVSRPVPRGQPPRLSPQLDHPGGEIVRDVVERSPQRVATPWNDQPAQRGGQFGDPYGHVASLASRPVRFSYRLTNCGRDSGRNSSRGIPVAAIAVSMDEGSPSTSTRMSISGYRSSRNVALPSRNTVTTRSIRRLSAKPSRSRSASAFQGSATPNSISWRCRYSPFDSTAPFQHSSPRVPPCRGRYTRRRSISSFSARRPLRSKR